jgi:hypothetical protein
MTHICTYTHTQHTLLWGVGSNLRGPVTCASLLSGNPVLESEHRFESCFLLNRIDSWALLKATSLRAHKIHFRTERKLQKRTHQDTSVQQHVAH